MGDQKRKTVPKDLPHKTLKFPLMCVISHHGDPKKGKGKSAIIEDSLHGYKRDVFFDLLSFRKEGKVSDMVVEYFNNEKERKKKGKGRFECVKGNMSEILRYLYYPKIGNGKEDVVPTDYENRIWFITKDEKGVARWEPLGHIYGKADKCHVQQYIYDLKMETYENIKKVPEEKRAVALARDGSKFAFDSHRSYRKMRYDNPPMATKCVSSLYVEDFLDELDPPLTHESQSSDGDQELDMTPPITNHEATSDTENNTTAKAGDDVLDFRELRNFLIEDKGVLLDSTDPSMKERNRKGIHDERVRNAGGLGSVERVNMIRSLKYSFEEIKSYGEPTPYEFMGPKLRLHETKRNGTDADGDPVYKSTIAEIPDFIGGLDTDEEYRPTDVFGYHTEHRKAPNDPRFGLCTEHTKVTDIRRLGTDVPFSESSRVFRIGMTHKNKKNTRYIASVDEDTADFSQLSTIDKYCTWIGIKRPERLFLFKGRPAPARNLKRVEFTIEDIERYLDEILPAGDFELALRAPTDPIIWRLFREHIKKTHPECVNHTGPIRLELKLGEWTKFLDNYCIPDPDNPSDEEPMENYEPGEQVSKKPQKPLPPDVQDKLNNHMMDGMEGLIDMPRSKRVYDPTDRYNDVPTKTKKTYRTNTKLTSGVPTELRNGMAVYKGTIPGEENDIPIMRPMTAAEQYMQETPKEVSQVVKTVEISSDQRRKVKTKPGLKSKSKRKRF